MSRKELSEVVAECAVRTERAAAWQRESAAKVEAARAGIEVARERQEEAVARQEAARARQDEAVARQEAATAKLDEAQVDTKDLNKKLDTLIEEMRADRARIEAEREDEKRWREEFLRRQEKMFQHYLARADQTLAEMKQQTAEIIAELREHRDERQAFKEAILTLIDRLPPPPPPHLRSA
ncbi:MAG TPA: hypothetical protein VGV69_02435 [Solirubrobacterales bacterium]|nr:hypothetical protein [Solirubrobacterales bacterium]